jgi:hypothetical protein
MELGVTFPHDLMARRRVVPSSEVVSESGAEAHHGSEALGRFEALTRGIGLEHLDLDIGEQYESRAEPISKTPRAHRNLPLPHITGLIRTS